MKQHHNRYGSLRTKVNKKAAPLIPLESEAILFA